MKKQTPQKLGDILSSVLAKRGYLTPSYEAEIKREWPSLVGEKIAEVSECTEMRGGVLYVRVSVASWRQELSFLKKEILKKIKEKTRCKSINEIIFF